MLHIDYDWLCSILPRCHFMLAPPARYVATHRHPNVPQSLELLYPRAPQSGKQAAAADDSSSSTPPHDVLLEGDGGPDIGRFRITQPRTALPSASSAGVNDLNRRPFVIKPSVSASSSSSEAQPQPLERVYYAGVSLANKLDRLTDEERLALKYVSDGDSESGNENKAAQTNTNAKGKPNKVGINEEEVWAIKDDAGACVVRSIAFFETQTLSACVLRMSDELAISHFFPSNRLVLNHISPYPDSLVSSLPHSLTFCFRPPPVPHSSAAAASRLWTAPNGAHARVLSGLSRASRIGAVRRRRGALHARRAAAARRVSAAEQ
jgi:hypothetical protein